jgi:hypothetical protein
MQKNNKKNLQKSKSIVFVSYSHKDVRWKDMLEPFLEALENYNKISYWVDHQIEVGKDWDKEIKKGMEKAQVAICIISINYLSSVFIKKKEIPYLLKKKRKEGMLLIPILVDDCPIDIAPQIKKIQMYPGEGKNLANDFEGKESPIFTKVTNSILNHFEKVIN